LNRASEIQKSACEKKPPHAAPCGNRPQKAQRFNPPSRAAGSGLFVFNFAFLRAKAQRGWGALDGQRFDPPYLGQPSAPISGLRLAFVSRSRRAEDHPAHIVYIGILVRQAGRAFIEPELVKPWRTSSGSSCLPVCLPGLNRLTEAVVCTPAKPQSTPVFELVVGVTCHSAATCASRVAPTAPKVPFGQPLAAPPAAAACGHVRSTPSSFISMIFVALTKFGDLDPIGRCAVGPRLSHISHSSEMICTILVRLLRPHCGRSVTLMWNSRRASCSVV